MLEIKITPYHSGFYTVKTPFNAFGTGKDFDALFYTVYKILEGRIGSSPKNREWSIEVDEEAELMLGNLIPTIKGDRTKELEGLVADHNARVQSSSE